jgi:hypothetical protein
MDLHGSGRAGYRRAAADLEESVGIDEAHCGCDRVLFLNKTNFCYNVAELRI